MTRRTLARISRSNGTGSSGYTFDNFDAAFRDILEIPNKKRKNREDTKARYKKKEKKEGQKDQRVNLVLREHFGKKI